MGFDVFWNSLITQKKVCILLGNRFDFDSFGSGFAIMTLLESIGIAVDIHYSTEVPLIVSEFFTPEEISRIKIENDYKSIDFKNYDAIVFNDVAQLQMVGVLGELFVLPQGIRTYNIDHHITNTNYADENLVMDRISTCRILYDLVIEMQLRMDPRTAFYLLIGHLTDSGFLKFNAVDANDIRMASELVNASGVSIYEIASKFDKSDLPTMKFQAFILSRIKEENDHIYVEYDDIEAEEYINAKMADITYGASDIIKRIKNKKYVFAIHQKRELSANGLHLYSVSFRSCDEKIDVSKLAQSLGGGGHKMAASAKFEAKDMSVAREIVQKRLKEGLS